MLRQDLATQITVPKAGLPISTKSIFIL